MNSSWARLKVSKNRKQIFQLELLPKTKPSNFFFYPDKYSYNSIKNTYC